MFSGSDEELWLEPKTLGWVNVLQLLQQKLTLVRWIVVEKHYDSLTSKCFMYINYSNITRTLTSLQVFTWGNWGAKRWGKNVLVAQSCLTLCNPRDCSPPGFTVHGILQARILEQVAIPFSRGSSPLRDWTRVSGSAGRIFTTWATGETQRDETAYSRKQN